jgi:hypothetical protein
MTEASTKQHPLMPLCHVVHAVYRPRPETAHIRCRPAHYPIPSLFLERQHLGSCPISTVSFDSKLYDQVARHEPVTFRGDSVTMAGHERMASMLGMPIIETPVLIIGSSMVGMTLSALLAKHGVRDCVTIERHPSTAIHPRAALFHPRTMQIYRELGLYDKMYAESLKHYDEHAGLHIVETLAGKHLGTYMKDINEWIEDISPTHRLFLTQQMFEPLLRQRAIDNGAVLRFSTELVDFQHDQEGVTALIRNVETGEKQIIRAKYMVACDGNRSPVREKLGIKSQGHGLLRQVQRSHICRKRACKRFLPTG